MRPRTPAEMRDLEQIVALTAEDARSLVESYDGRAEAEDLLEAIRPLQTLMQLVHDLKQHAATSRRKKAPAKATAKK